jgi:hypothetical protein
LAVEAFLKSLCIQPGTARLLKDGKMIGHGAVKSGLGRPTRRLLGRPSSLWKQAILFGAKDTTLEAERRDASATLRSSAFVLSSFLAHRHFCYIPPTIRLRL